MSAPRLAIVCAGMLSLACRHAAGQPPPPLASLSLATEPSGLVDVPVQIGGKAATLRVNTGFATSMLSESGAARLGLPRANLYHEFVLVSGPQGLAQVKQQAIADSIRFDHFDAPSAKFLIVPDDFFPIEMAGLLGADILRNDDIEFDFTKGELNLCSPGQCPDVMQGGTVADLPMDVTGGGLVRVDVQLDGKPVTAGLATGSPMSILSLAAGQDIFGISEKTAGLKTLASHNGLAYLVSYPFRTLAFQGASVTDPDIEIQTNIRQKPDLILGMSVLRQLHFCLGYDAEKLYVTSSNLH